jgi:PAS domain S-box-containing protein
VVGKRASAILAAPELASWLAIFGRVAAGGPSVTYDTYSPHNQKHFRGHAYSLKKGTFSVAFEDATERNQARAQLAESEARYRTLVETAEDAILLTDLDGRHIFKNSAYYIGLGYAPGEPILASGYDRVHPDDVARLRQVAATLLTRGSAASEYRIRHKDGHWIWRSSRSTVIRDEFGKPKAILAVLRDISIRKGMEEELRENRARLSLALRSAQMGVWHWDVESDQRFFDDQVCALLGIDPMTFTGLAEEFFRCVHSDDRAKIGVALARTLSHDAPYQVEYRVVWKDASVHHISARGALVRDQAGKAQRINGVIWDVTTRMRAQTERQSLQAQLFQAQKMEALGTLAGGIAHDFNNILAAVLGGVELAIMKADELGGAQGASMRVELDEVQRAAQRASALVRQILSFSRQNPEEKKALLVRPLIKEACKFICSALPSTIEIHQALSVDGPVLANPTQIHQVIMNLLTNAGLAMPEGGRLDVGLDQVELDQTFPAAHPGLAPKPFVRLLVRDSGCGIPPENLGRIFEPLFTTRSERRGTGLGLAIVHGIVAEHGGIVTVSSEVGKGATFEVFLPLHQQPISVTALREKRLPGTERVLFVDDEETLVQMAERGLGVLGYQVKGFVSSVEALRAFRAAPDAFDIVVSDFTMPGLTGDVLARELRKARPEIPIVILTGAGERMTQKGDSPATSDAILLKPITVGGLTTALRRILDSRDK